LQSRRQLKGSVTAAAAAAAAAAAEVASHLDSLLCMTRVIIFLIYRATDSVLYFFSFS